jgi:hypothetical protein
VRSSSAGRRGQVRRCTGLGESWPRAVLISRTAMSTEDR